jgi:phosphatidylserine/phosphatidylglycerophosphate/cardiolipin synthase-like enzyme
MQLIVEPADGVRPLLSAIQRAKKSIEIAVFRFDRSDIETALKAAAARGVKVTALIALANRGGDARLRRLESRCLQAGITVARTCEDADRHVRSRLDRHEGQERAGAIETADSLQHERREGRSGLHEGTDPLTLNVKKAVRRPS